MFLPDGDEAEAISPSQLPAMVFFGNCLPKCCHAHSTTHGADPSRKLLKISYRVPRWFCQFLLERLAMWPRGHISNRMRSASFGLRLLRQCERPCCPLAVVGGCTALFMVGAIYDPARGFLARRGEPGGGT